MMKTWAGAGIKVRLVVGVRQSRAHSSSRLFELSDISPAKVTTLSKGQP